MLSKHFAHVECADVLHTWTKSCSHACWTMFISSVVGSCKLFLPIILVKFVLKLQKKKKITKETIRLILHDYIQCITVATFMSTTFLSSSCTLRYLLGKFTYFSITFFPGMFAGLSFALFKPELRVQILTAFGNATLETIALKMSHSGLFPLNVYTETIFFMITNACLMYALKKPRFRHLMYSWFFKPDKDDPKNDDTLFLRRLFVKMNTYFGLGLGYGILRTLSGNINILKPANIHKIFKMNTLRPGIFASSYVAIYELTIYILYRYFQKNQSVYALPAGFLAGLSYAVDPNLPVSLSAFINLIQILYELVNIRLLKRIPMDIILFCLSSGIIMHVQMFYPKSMSNVGSKIIKLSSGKRCNYIIEAMQKLSINAI